MSERVEGVVINLNAFGATIRLESGELASAPEGDVSAHRPAYERSLSTHKPLDFELRSGGRRPLVTLLPQIQDDGLDQQIAVYLKETQEWEGSDGVPVHERRFLQKKRRAAIFESKHQA